MWSMVSEHYSTLPFDYAAYTAANLATYAQALDAWAVELRRIACGEASDSNAVENWSRNR